MLVPSRRGFLAGLAALVAAPALVRADNLMPISAAKLWTPSTSIIGVVKPIVGAIPEGWFDCDVRWLIAQKFPALEAFLKGKNLPEGISEWGAQVWLPDMRLQALFDRSAGKEVGRYVMY